MSRQVWKGSTLLNPEPPVLVSCGSPEKPNLITVGWCGTICTQPPMLSISVRPERYSHQSADCSYFDSLSWKCGGRYVPGGHSQPAGDKARAGKYGYCTL